MRSAEACVEKENVDIAGEVDAKWRWVDNGVRGEVVEEARFGAGAGLWCEWRLDAEVRFETEDALPVRRAKKEVGSSGIEASVEDEKRERRGGRKGSSFHDKGLNVTTSGDGERKAGRGEGARGRGGSEDEGARGG